MSDPRDALIEEILKANNSYEVLGVDQSCNVDATFRKAYLSRSLKCHPDKNKHKNATTAFQRVAESYEALQTEDKRLVYQRNLRFGNKYGSGYTSSPNFEKQVFVGEVSVEEALNMFNNFVRSFESQMEAQRRDSDPLFYRQSNVFDLAAYVLRYIDGISKDPGDTAEQPIGDTNTTIASLAKVATVAATVYHVYSTFSELYKGLRGR